MIYCLPPGLTALACARIILKLPLLLKAVVPYALAKLEQLHIDTTLDTATTSSSVGRQGGIRSVLVKLYPYIHFTWEVCYLWSSLPPYFTWGVCCVWSSLPPYFTWGVCCVWDQSAPLLHLGGMLCMVQSAPLLRLVGYGVWGSLQYSVRWLNAYKSVT